MAFKGIIRSTVAVTALCAAGLCGPSVSAQDAPEGAAIDSGSEIVVTAQKREQRLSDVGLTISAISGDTLKDRQIDSLEDIAASVPGLSFATTQNGTPVFTLRGVGYYETSLAAYPTVSSYLDEVPLTFPILSSHVAYDLERVEVLKGPQGILFGQNATGGAINYIAAKPRAEFGAGGSLTYGRFNQVDIEGYATGALADGVTARLSVRAEYGDPWQKSNSRPDASLPPQASAELGRRQNLMGRFQLAVEPSDRVRLLFNVNGWIDKSDPQAPQYIGYALQNPIAPPGLIDAPVSPRNPRAADWTPNVPRRDNSMWQASLRGDFDVTDDITLTSISSYVRYRQDQADEGDGLPILNLDLVKNDGWIKSFSQEVRLANSGTGRLKWVVGANYEKSNVDQTVESNSPDSTATATFFQNFGYTLRTGYYINEQDMRNYAFFGNVEVTPIDLVTVKAGVRYTNSRATNYSCMTDLTGLPNDLGGVFMDIIQGGRLGPYIPGSCLTVNDLGTAINGVPAGDSGAYTGKLSEDNISWRLGVDVKPNDDLLLYANVAKGYKAGGFPTTSATFMSQFQSVPQESVLSVEGGVKISALDRALQVNAAGFYYDYANKQLRGKVNNPIFGILDQLVGVPGSRIYGGEIELNLRPAKGLTLNSSFTYIEAEITDYTGVDPNNQVRDFSGTRIPFTPKYQFAASADYEFDVGAVRASLGATVNARSKTVGSIGGDINPTSAVPNNFLLRGIDGYTLVDLRASIYDPDRSWRVGIWGKNVANKYYWHNAVAGYDTFVRYAGMPATYGVTVSFEY